MAVRSIIKNFSSTFFQPGEKSLSLNYDDGDQTFGKENASKH